MIRQEDVDHWNKHGFVIIKDFLTVEEFDKLTEAWKRLVPDWTEFKARPSVYKNYTGTSPRNPSHSTVVRHDFPYSEEACNELAVHPYLVALAERLAESDDLALSYGHFIGKHAGRGDYDQQLHSDYGNNTLVTPHPDKKFFHLPIIIYLTDVTPDIGPTKVVSQTLTEPRGLMKEGGFYPRDKYPELYENEVSVEVPAGSAVVYSMRTLHRGSAMKAKEGCRMAQFVGFHTANCPWMAPLDHQAKMGTPESHKFLIHADPAQRSVLRPRLVSTADSGAGPTWVSLLWLVTTGNTRRYWKP